MVRSRFTTNSLILLYHRVARDERDPFKLCVSPSHFAEQLGALRQRGVRLPSVAEFVRHHREGSLSAGTLCLTFDDGYVDFIEEALPVLEAHDSPAVIYCVAGGLGRPFWWDRLLDSIESGVSKLSRLEFNSRGSEISLEFSGKGRDGIFSSLYPFFRALEPSEREEQLAALDQQTGHRANASQRRLMTEEEMAVLAAHPLITIGAHTVSHPSLAGLNPAAQFAEIDRSLKKLGDIIGHKVSTFSYPFGLRGRDYTAATVDAVRRAGLDHALAADADVVTQRSDPHALPRLWIHDVDAARFCRRLNGWL